jgi:hypothetical protein
LTLDRIAKDAACVSIVWIGMIVGGGVLVLAAVIAFVVYLVRSSLQERRDAARAWAEFSTRFGFTLGSQAGPYGSDPLLQGVFDGAPLEIAEYWKSEGGGRGYRLLTRWRSDPRLPWPGGLVAYTPGFGKALGGPWGRIHDTRNPVVAAVAMVNDYTIGDPELDRTLAIDATDRDVVRALLITPDVKSWILRSVSRFEHIRICGSEATIEIERRATSLEELVEGARCVTSVARALSEASARLAR